MGSDATTTGIYGAMFQESLSTKLYAVIKAFLPLYVSPLVAAGRHGTKLWQCLVPRQPVRYHMLRVCVYASRGVKTVGEGNISYRQGCWSWLSA